MKTLQHSVAHPLIQFLLINFALNRSTLAQNFGVQASDSNSVGQRLLDSKLELLYHLTVFDAFS